MLLIMFNFFRSLTAHPAKAANIVWRKRCLRSIIVEIFQFREFEQYSMMSGKVLLPIKMAEKYTNNANSHQLVKPWWTSRSCSMVSCPRRPSHIYLSSRSIYTIVPGKPRNSQIICSHHHHEHQHHHHDRPQLTWEEERRVKAPGELHLSLCWSSTAKVTWGGKHLRF